MPRDDVLALDLNLLLTFRVFVEEGTVHAAARRLGRTQPAISARLRALRESLETELVVRQGRRLTLTPWGRRVYEHACLVERQAETLIDEMRSSHPVGTLRVGLLPTLATYVAPAVIAQVRKEYAGLRFELETGLVGGLMDRLQQRELDLVVGIGRPPAGDPLDLGSVRPVHLMRGDRAAPQTWVTYGPTEDDFFSAVERYLETRDEMRHVVVRTSHIETLKRLVVEGVGDAILPDYTVRDLQVRKASLPELDLSQPVWAIRRRPEDSIPALDRWVAHFRTPFSEGHAG